LNSTLGPFLLVVTFMSFPTTSFTMNFSLFIANHVHENP
jgi:hypothetical protein